MDSTELDNNNANISILVLSPPTTIMVSSLLNPPKLLRSQNGLPRDWQGLAELCGITGELIPSFLQDQDPTGKVLKWWSDHLKAEATVDRLIRYLEQLERFDVVDDILPLVEERAKKKGFCIPENPTTTIFFPSIDYDPTITLQSLHKLALTADLKVHKERARNGKTVKEFDLDADNKVITIDDVHRISEGLKPQLYDAFVLFDAEDIDFATELINTMEKTYDLKFCVKERDLVGGGSEHAAVIKLIADRCGRVIVILSPTFLQSDANAFFYRLAQSISIDQRIRKIIPCIYKDCGKLPPELDCYFKLDIRRSGPLWNFWDKLYHSIKLPEKPRTKLSLPENKFVSNTEHLKPSLHKDKSESRNTLQSVKFSSSMSNLPNTEVPEDIIVPSTSENSLGAYEEKAVKKTFSILKKIKSLVPKSKSIKGCSAEEPFEKPEENNSCNKIEQQNSDKDRDNIDKNIKQEKEKKKRMKFSLRINKKKAVLADT